jgi:hypothetical protein
MYRDNFSRHSKREEEERSDKKVECAMKMINLLCRQQRGCLDEHGDVMVPGNKRGMMNPSSIQES